MGERVRLLDGSFATVTRVQVEHAPCADPAWQPGMSAAGTLGTAADAQTGTSQVYVDLYGLTPQQAQSVKATVLGGPNNLRKRIFFLEP